MRNAFRSWMSAATFLAASAVASGAAAEPADILQFQGRLLSAAGSPVPNPHTCNCPSGYTTFAAASVKGWTNRGHISSAGNSLYIGGLYGWAHQDLHRGYIASWFEGEVASKLCFKMFNGG